LNIFLAPTIFPSPEVIHYVGQPATIFCLVGDGSTTVQWFINNAQLGHSQPDVVVITLPTLSSINI